MFAPLGFPSLFRVETRYLRGFPSLGRFGRGCPISAFLLRSRRLVRVLCWGGGGGDDDLLGSRRLVRVLCWVGGGMMTILQETFALDLQLLLRDTLRRSRPCAWERSWTSAATTHARSATVELSLTLSCPKAYLSSEFKVFSPYISPAGFVEGWMVLTSRLRFALPLFFVVLDGAFHSPCTSTI